MPAPRPTARQPQNQLPLELTLRQGWPVKQAHLSSRADRQGNTRIGGSVSLDRDEFVIPSQRVFGVRREATTPGSEQIVTFRNQVAFPDD
jgi:hypothetical protein